MKSILALLLLCVGAMSFALDRAKRQEAQFPAEVKDKMVKGINEERSKLAEKHKVINMKYISWSDSLNVPEPSCDDAFTMEDFEKMEQKMKELEKKMGDDEVKIFDFLENHSAHTFLNCLDPLQTQIRVRGKKCGDKIALDLFCGPYIVFDRRHVARAI